MSFPRDIAYFTLNSIMNFFFLSELTGENERKNSSELLHS